MDWDKIKLFYEVAEAGSFTRAGEKLDLNQSSLSRSISALERDLNVPLFHRHARGLILTEHGDALFRAALDMRRSLEVTRQRFAETSERLDLYLEVNVQLILTNDDLDLAMREADLAIRLRRPVQPDLIQRRLFTIHYHAYAAHAYLDHFGEPRCLEDLDHHRIVCLGGNQPAFILDLHRLPTLGRDPKSPRASRFVVNDSLALRHAIESGAGIGMAPDYAMGDNPKVRRVLEEVDMPALDSYLVYPEEMRSVARVQVFRDFLVTKAQRWVY